MNRIIILFMAIALFSCKGRNNPNLKESQLAGLLSDSTQVAEKEPGIVLPDTGYIPPAGARFKENRSADAPVKVLKVDIPAGNKEVLKLSSFGKSIEYTKLRLPDESDFFLSETTIHINGEQWAQTFDQSTRVYKAGNCFVTEDMLGIRLFDNKGAYTRTLVDSEFVGSRTPGNIEISYEGFKQAVLIDIFGDYCYLAQASTGGISSGIFRLSSQELSMTSFPARYRPWGKYIDKNARLVFLGSYRSKALAVSLDVNGDTLCKFNNYITLPEEMKKKTIANSDRPFLYRSGNRLFFRQAYNDTIFRVESPARIVPVFRFDFGSLRVGLEDGLRANTAGKLIPWKLIDFKDKLVLIYTAGRDCPNCRKAGEVTFYCTMYEKSTGKATPVDMKTLLPENILIENDIDGGLPLPLNYVNITDNQIIAGFTKKQIADILGDQSVPADKAGKLRELADTLQQNEMLVMSVRM